MYLVRFLVSTVLFLLPLVHAAGIGEVNGANEALASETDKYDANVNNVNIVNGVIGAIVPSHILLNTSVPSRSCIPRALSTISQTSTTRSCRVGKMAREQRRPTTPVLSRASLIVSER